MKKIVLAALAATSLTAPAFSAVTVYSTRSAFNNAAGSVVTETFNSVRSDTSFQTTAAVFGAMSVQGYGPNQFDRNYVDVQPLQFSEFNVDGTTILNALTGRLSGVTFTFANPVFAFGADFAAFQDDFARSTITVAGQTLTPPIQSGDNIFFYGFTSTTAFTTVTFANTGIEPDGFGIDNVSYTSATVAVPEPATWAMMIAGFGLVGGAMRRRKTSLPTPNSILA